MDSSDVFQNRAQNCARDGDEDLCDKADASMKLFLTSFILLLYTLGSISSVSQSLLGLTATPFLSPEVNVEFISTAKTSPGFQVLSTTRLGFLASSPLFSEISRIPHAGLCRHS
ncbi:hypothetical protein N656DRAFT_781441 [Canariomyces notabilis]|uniref:Uncharacterized protein n=1 Tax=Canariomyces notabilis TaxID=2074819 RepID=A0AAN6TAZ6_9PEZI|nr:hypothetical protein N656DRAFT_781441 [Canariomyces arenarius]